MLSRLALASVSALLALSFDFTHAAAGTTVCKWNTVVGDNRYSFDLTKPVGGNSHGIQNEDGSYEVVQPDASGSAVTYWFQVCDALEFNSPEPHCDFCSESCGGSEHCGQTCGALQQVYAQGYSQCTTLAGLGNATFSLMDPTNPALGISMLLPAGDPAGCPAGTAPALTVNIQCSRKGEIQEPTAVTEDPPGSCLYSTTIVHPLGCPAVSSAVPWGFWPYFGICMAGAILAFVAYMAIGMAYRHHFHGASGYEAIPHREYLEGLHSQAVEATRPLVNHVSTTATSVHGHAVEAMRPHVEAMRPHVERVSSAANVLHGHVSSTATVVHEKVTTTAAAVHTTVTTYGTQAIESIPDHVREPVLTRIASARTLLSSAMSNASRQSSGAASLTAVSVEVKGGEVSVEQSQQTVVSQSSSISTINATLQKAKASVDRVKNMLQSPPQTVA